jgi:hypothetical protein
MWFGSACCGGTYIAAVGTTAARTRTALRNQCTGATQVTVSQDGFPNITCTAQPPPPPQNFYWAVACCGSGSLKVEASSNVSFENALDALDPLCPSTLSNIQTSYGTSAPSISCPYTAPPPPGPTPPPPTPSPSFTEALVTNGMLGKVYSDGVSANNTSSYSVASGSLPPGLSLNTTNGDITGTPTQQGSFTFAINASGAGGTTGSGSLTIQILPAGNRRNSSGFDSNLLVAKRYNGTAWVDLTTMKRFNGTSWVNIIN